MMNDYARQVLDRGDQAVLLGQAAEALNSGHSGAVVVELPSGISVRMHCRPVASEAAAGGVVTVRLIEPDTAGGRVRQPARMYLPGIVGSGPLWLRGCHEVDAVYGSGDWLALRGEPAPASWPCCAPCYQRRNPAGRFHVLDAAEAW